MQEKIFDSYYGDFVSVDGKCYNYVGPGHKIPNETVPTSTVEDCDSCLPEPCCGYEVFYLNEYFPMTKGTDRNTCKREYYWEPIKIVNNYSGTAFLRIKETIKVDDDLEVDGVVFQDGEYATEPHHLACIPPKNGSHEIPSGIILKDDIAPGQTVRLNVINRHYRNSGIEYGAVELVCKTYGGDACPPTYPPLKKQPETLDFLGIPISGGRIGFYIDRYNPFGTISTINDPSSPSGYKQWGALDIMRQELKRLLDNLDDSSHFGTHFYPGSNQSGYAGLPISGDVNIETTPTVRDVHKKNIDDNLIKYPYDNMTLYEKDNHLWAGINYGSVNRGITEEERTINNDSYLVGSYEGYGLLSHSEFDAIYLIIGIDLGLHSDSSWRLNRTVNQAADYLKEQIVENSTFSPERNAAHTKLNIVSFVEQTSGPFYDWLENLASEIGGNFWPINVNDLSNYNGNWPI